MLIATDDLRVEASAWKRNAGEDIGERRNGTERTAEIARMILADYYANVR